MSSLDWSEAVYQPFRDPTVPSIYWELWDKGTDRTAWYNLPCASIRKIRDRQWELTMPNEIDNKPRYFTTLKAAKAMGVALYRMDNDE